jgi:hypothetical protein
MDDIRKIRDRLRQNTTRLYHRMRNLGRRFSLLIEILFLSNMSFCDYSYLWFWICLIFVQFLVSLIFSIILILIVIFKFTCNNKSIKFNLLLKINRIFAKSETTTPEQQHYNNTVGIDSTMTARNKQTTQPPLHKVIMVGSGGVGKSALTLQFMYDEVYYHFLSFFIIFLSLYFDIITIVFNYL